MTGRGVNNYTRLAANEVIEEAVQCLPVKVQ
jgi:hypothetical protein